MKHFVTFFLKPLSFLPALVMMYAIYSFSAQTGTESGNLSHMISVKIVETASDTLQKDLDDWEVEELADHINSYLQDGDMVLVKASRGMHFEKICDRIKDKEARMDVC